MEKSFLFDVVSKVYIATDSNPVDMQSYELCSDMIDVVIDVSCIYGYATSFNYSRNDSNDLDVLAV
jgi:Ras-related GTP-binding protein C/D